MNNKYASVYFSLEELDAYRNFLLAMNGLHIIEISREEIEENIRYLQLACTGTNNRLVLHNDAEVSSFKNIMKAFFPNKEYQITDDPADKAFAEWLENKKKRLTI